MPRLAPVVDLLNDAAQGVAHQVVGFAALVGDADEAFFGVVVVFDAMAIGLDAALDLAQAGVFQAGLGAILVQVADEVVFRVIGAGDGGAAGQRSWVSRLLAS